MFGLLRLIVLLAIAAAIAGVVFYFAPDNIKEQGLAYLNESNLVPIEIKKAAESIYATPKYNRGKLEEELAQNFANLESIIRTTASNPEPIIQKIQRTKEIVEEIKEVKSDPTFISKVTEIVTERVLSAVSGNPEYCPKPGQ